jgi:hypothetical protein
MRYLFREQIGFRALVEPESNWGGEDQLPYAMSVECRKLGREHRIHRMPTTFAILKL